MRFIGGKTNLLNDIESMVLEKVGNYSNQKFLDLFSGTGVVAYHFKKYFKVITNDSLYFSYILAKGHVTPNNVPKFTGLNKLGIHDPLDYLNDLSGQVGFIQSNYASDGDGRMYLTPRNARKIDHIRLTLGLWLNKGHINLEEFEYLLATLIEAVPFVSNITGTYGAYLKHWDKRAFKDLVLKHPILYDNNQINESFHSKSEDISNNISVDICYIDPPYNGRQYTSNYHLLETIAKYDSPIIKGVTGIRKFDTNETSDFCKKSKVYNAFKKVLSQVNCKHLFLSYNSDGLLKKEQIEEILLSIGIPKTYDFREIEYRRYKSKIVLKPKVTEYLFYIEKQNHE
ncbi:DNA adenine methylase [Acinetobacter sp. B5B]|uniref:DNA adenine methylase n=1 Tax=Acinetobacter baretiae TaxID=2605383 RepID=UPI0018C2D75D|nr:DNA adenine methylase [Acinetobacter baretiae]MBF7682978.1 DNA adenine methylase [Acinetobacter baretiae]